MPTFDTPEPIAATIDMAAGSVRVTASARADTVVEVRPRGAESDADAQAAEQTRVTYTEGELLVQMPKSWVRSLFGPGPSIALDIELPEGSHLDVTAWAGITRHGRLGDVRIKTAVGGIRLAHTAELRAKTSTGDITVGGAAGSADIHTSAGDVRVGDVTGTAAVKSSSGDLAVGEVTGDLRLTTGHGDIAVDRALTSVGAKAGAGDIRIGEVMGGSVVLQTGHGELDLGVPDGTSAWLDTRSPSGTVHSALAASDGPAASERTVQIHARTHFGDIIVRRV